MELIAHVKWFVEEQVSGFPFITVSEYLAVLLLVAAGLWGLGRIAGTSAYQHMEKRIAKRLRPYGDFVPTIIRLTTGVLILANIWSDNILAPNISNTGENANLAAVSVLSLSAILLLSGLFIRSAAVMLALGYLAVLVNSGFFDSLDHLEYLAIAAYLFFRGAGAWRVTLPGITEDKPPKPDKYRPLALPLYISLAGFALAALAFSEKLFNLDLAQSFLYRYDWNFLSFAGISDRVFILFIGAVELLIGLSFVFRIATKLTSLIVLMTMLTTVILLGPSEITGHLFAIGLVAAVWIPDIYGSRPS